MRRYPEKNAREKPIQKNWLGIVVWVEYFGGRNILSIDKNIVCGVRSTKSKPYEILYG
jgi:hypothetical protein